MLRPALCLVVPAVLLSLTGCGHSLPSTVSTSQAAVSASAERAYNIIDMQGIGPVYAGKLRADGLTNTDRFLAATSDRASRHQVAETTGISYKLLTHWAHMAELMRIQGIGVKEADLLESIGVTSVKDLAQRDPAKLADRVGIANHVGREFVHRTPSEATVSKWIEAAKAMPATVSDEE